MDPIDTIVVGGGPAGLSAALWLGRHRCSVLLVDGGEPRNASTRHVHGYFGLDPVAPAGLLERGRSSLAEIDGVRLLEDGVRSITGSVDAFRAILDSGTTVAARRVVLATGVVDRLPEIDGLPERYGHSVFHCPTCDGPEALGRRVAVVATPEAAPSLAARLSRWASDVFVIEDGEAGVARLEGEEPSLSAVRLEDGSVLEADLLFFTLEERVRNELAVGLGCDTDAEGHVPVNGYGLTSVDGVYAVGDMTPGLHIVQVAAAEGAVAGIACADSLTA